MMYAFPGESFESAMNIPVPIRKWLIDRWNRQKKKEQQEKSSTSDVNEPLSPKEKEAMKRKILTK